MSKSLIRVGLAAALVASLAACGDAASGTSTTAPVTIPPTNFKTIPTVPESTTTTVAPADPGAPPAAGDKTTTITDYKVKAGDNPTKIAKLYGIAKAELDAANATTADYQRFLVGMTIKIPVGATIPQATPTGTTVLDTATGDSTPAGSTSGSGPAGSSAAPTSSTTPLKSNCAPGNYQLVSGDTPTKVAKKFGVSVAQLDAANENTKGYKSFIVGTKISIPTFNC